MQLPQVPVGTEAVVVSVANGEAGEGRRLEDVGFVAGTRVRVERRAPLGDPTVYVLRGTRISLRREGAALITVEVVGGDAAEADAPPSTREATRG